MAEEISSLARCVLQQMSNCVYTMQLSSPWVTVRSHCRCCFLSVSGHELKDKASSHGRHVWGGRRQVDAEGTVAHRLAHFQSAVPVVTRKVLPSGKVWLYALLFLAQLTRCKRGKVHIPERQASNIVVGNWILWHSGLSPFVWDAVEDVASSNFIEMVRRANAGGFCCQSCPCHLLELQVINRLLKTHNLVV